jgi:hypothetical protein
MFTGWFVENYHNVLESFMSTNKLYRRSHWLSAAALGALVLIATAVPLTPAKAFFGGYAGGYHRHYGHYANYGRGHYHHHYR